MDELESVRGELAEAEKRIKDKFQKELAQEKANSEQSGAEPALGPIEGLMDAIQKQELKFRARAPLRPFDILNEFIIKDKFNNN